VLDEDGALRFSGPGHLFNKYRCLFASGCSARLSVDLAQQGGATIGFLIHTADGRERDNVLISVPKGEGVHSICVEAAAGETLRPYVFARSPEGEVRVRSFCTVLASSSPAP
jgi:hypothetical protein